MSQSKVVYRGSDSDHLHRFAVTTPKPTFVGEWSFVELQPDVFVPQRFTVGVVVQSPGDRLHFKLLDDFKKFECLYHDQFPQKSARELLAYAEEALRRAVRSRTAIHEIIFETHCLMLAPPQFTSGEDRESTVERLFGEVVVMAPSGKRKVSEFESVDTPHAREIVNQELKLIAEMDFERFVKPGKQGMLVDFEGVKHFLDLNLLTSKACGSVTSACYKSVPSVEINLLKSSRDLTTYSRVHKMDSIGLFLLLPDASLLEPKEFKRIEEVISEHEWKLERDDFRVVSRASPAELAKEIYDWAKPSLG
jgi:hypothetical protein